MHASALQRQHQATAVPPIALAVVPCGFEEVADHLALISKDWQSPQHQSKLALDEESAPPIDLGLPWRRRGPTGEVSHDYPFARFEHVAMTFSARWATRS